MAENIGTIQELANMAVRNIVQSVNDGALNVTVQDTHNDLDGLQGGTEAERYHLTATERSAVSTMASGGGVDSGAGLEKVVYIESTVQDISTYVNYPLPTGLSHSDIVDGCVTVRPFSGARTYIYPLFYSVSDSADRYAFAYGNSVRVFWGAIALDVGGTDLSTSDEVLIRLVVKP